MNNTPQILSEKDGEGSSSHQKNSDSITNQIEILETSREILSRARATIPERNIPNLEYCISAAVEESDMEALLVYEKFGFGSHPIDDIASIIRNVREQTSKSILDVITEESLSIKNKVMLELLSNNIMSFQGPNAEKVTAYAIIHPEKTPAIIDLICLRSITSFEEITEILSNTALPFSDGAL